MTAVAGLVVAAAPDYAHYLPFLLPIAGIHRLGAGIATGLAAAVAAIVFMALAALIIQCESANGLYAPRLTILNAWNCTCRRQSTVEHGLAIGHAAGVVQN